MKCAICKHGTTAPGSATVVLEKDESTIEFQKVPAEICTNCGEEYISSLINATLLSLAREELNKGVTLEVLRYAA